MISSDISVVEVNSRTSQACARFIDGRILPPYALRSKMPTQCLRACLIRANWPRGYKGNAMIIRRPFGIGQFRIDWIVSVGRLREFDEERSGSAMQAVRVALTSVFQRQRKQNCKALINDWI